MLETRVTRLRQVGSPAYGVKDCGRPRSQSPERDRGPEKASIPGKEWIINNITADDPTTEGDSPERFWQKALATSG